MFNLGSHKIVTWPSQKLSMKKCTSKDTPLPLGHPWWQPGDSRPSQLGGEKARWNLWVERWRQQCVCPHNMMHAPTDSEHPGRGGGREGGRLQDVCDCPTYNAFSDRCHGITRSRNVERLAMQIDHWVQKVRRCQQLSSVSLPLYFHNRNIWTTTMMSLVWTMMSLVSGESSGQRQYKHFPCYF